jgi:hypothetical protein
MFEALVRGAADMYQMNRDKATPIDVGFSSAKDEKNSMRDGLGLVGTAV